MAKKAETDMEQETVVAAEQETSAAEGQKMVEIRLFKDGEKYKDPVFVAVNGKTYMIERGVKVSVPDYVAEVLANSEAQLAEADRVMLNAAFKNDN